MEEIRFEVRHPDGRRERLVVQASRATVGAGAHCDVRLAVDQAAAEHVVVELVADGVRFQGVASAPPAALDGVPLGVRVVPQWGLLKIGDTQIHAARAPRDVAAKPGTARSTMLVRVACVLAVPAVLALFLMSKRRTFDVEELELPNLFSTSDVACPRTESAEARVLGADQRTFADAARERSPFSPREAVEAVNAYTVAAACYRLAHDEAAATEAEAASKDLREATVLELRARRLRLEHSLAVKDFELASNDVDALTRLTEGQQGPFVAWLGGVERQIKSQRTEKP